MPMRASPLNCRDLLTILDPESRAVPYLNSDGAGATGPDVPRFASNDRVAERLFQRWEYGPVTAEAIASAAPWRTGRRAGRGGARAGPHACAGASVVEEAATLPCATLTSWHAAPAAFSVCASQFAPLHGARPMVI